MANDWVLLKSDGKVIDPEQRNPRRRFTRPGSTKTEIRRAGCAGQEHVGQTSGQTTEDGNSFGCRCGPVQEKAGLERSSQEKHRRRTEEKMGGFSQGSG
jgi:hypothetical protein